MLPNGDRYSYMNRQYLNPPKDQTLRNSQSLNPRQFLPPNFNHNNSPRPIAQLRDRDSSRDQIGQKMRMMKNKAINLSINSRNGLSQNSLYPTQLIFLLSNQEGNVEHLRKTIDEEKKRVNRDFDNFSKQIFHMIQDLKLSIHSQLDFVFRDFINLYGRMKTQVLKMRQTRKKIIETMSLQQHQNKPTRGLYYNPNPNNNGMNTSNFNLLQQISKDQDYFKNHRMYEEVTNAYLEAIGPIMVDAQNILTIGSQTQYYKDQKCNEILNNIRNNFFAKTKVVFENQLDQLVIQAKNIIQDNNMLLKDLNIQDPKIERSLHQPYASQQKYRQSSPINTISNLNINTNKKKRAETQANPYGIEPPTFKNNFYSDNQKPKAGLRPSSSSEHLKIRPRPQSQWSSRRKDFQIDKQRYTVNTNNGYQRPQKYRPTKDQQNIIVEWVQSVQFNKNTTINCSNAQDILLCLLFVNQGKNIVVGSKDRNIYVFSTVGGKLVQTLSGHRASVCSLSNFNSFFASGGDNGCGSLILWQPNTWKLKRKVNLHTAALTCIVDLLDGAHLATGGYDKKIIVYNYKKNQSAFQVNSCRSGVTSLVICEQARKLVSAGLDSTLTIWNIFTKNGQLETVSFERIITNCGLACSLRCLVLAPDIILVGNKDGKVMMINVHTGQIVKTLSVGRGSILQISTIQRHNKPQIPLILTCSNGERELIITKGDTCQSTKVRINIGFGCGIVPKLVFDDSGMLAVVNQSSVEKEITLYWLEVS